MQIILQKAKINHNELKSYILRTTADELNRLSEPCYYPDWKVHYNDLLHIIGLTDSDIKIFVKRFYAGTKMPDRLLQTDSGSNLLIIILYYFLSQNDMVSYSTTMIYYMTRQYGNFMRRVIKFCKPDVFLKALENLNQTHLFVREKGIANALFHLSNELRKRYTESFTALDAEGIASFIFEARGRIAQSIRSFQDVYYRISKEGGGIRNPYENEQGQEVGTQELEKGKRIAEMISKKICVYKEIDYTALENARKLSKIQSSLAINIVKELHNLKYSDEIKFIIELYILDTKSTEDICGKNFLVYVKNLMGIKRTIKKVYYKQEINNLIVKIIKSLGLIDKYEKFTSQTQFAINSFLSFYLAYYTRNTIC